MLLLRCLGNAPAGEGRFNMPPLAGWSRSVATHDEADPHPKNVQHRPVKGAPSAFNESALRPGARLALTS